MKTELVEKSPIEREIKIEIEADAIREVYNKVSQKYAKQANVPGFRKGLAPLDVIRLRYKEDIKNEVIRTLLPDQVTAAIQEYNLQPLTEPHLHFDDWENMKVNGSQPITLHIHFEIMPEIPMPEYKGLDVVRRIRPVPQEQIDGIIDEKRQEGASLIPVEGRKSKEGDTVIIDLEGTFVGEENAEPIRADDLEITLGDANIEKSFTENLAGLEEDDEKEFTMEYPEDFSAQALAGKTVNYKAKVKSVGTIELPELDDEWVKSLDENFKSVKDMRQQISKDLEAMAKNEADMRVRNDLIGKIIEGNNFPVPNALIESQARNLLNNFAQDLQGRGIDIKTVDENFIKMAYEQMKGQAENDVRGAILLEKIADAEKVDVSQEDIDQEIGYMAQYYSVSPDEIRKTQGIEANIANNLRTRKAVEVIFENAKIKDEEWIEEGEPHPIVEEETEEKGKAKKPKGEKKEKEEKPKKKPSKKEKAA